VGPNGDFTCEKDADDHVEHQAHTHSPTNPDQLITWFDGDRRNYQGEFQPCDESTCSLPAGHARGHAR
jgi:hypothetical protein